ncbi:MAG: DUF5615 family PIN-like protein [Chloroflexi bacterium]|nr:DUF5615 family PIN-like protein [Chloroflexota bacterium]
MEDQKLRFYLDEHMPVVIARELMRRGIDTVTVKGLELRGDSDENHLALATQLGRCICTMDDDYVKLAKLNVAHAGIVIGTRKDRQAIGTWVRFLIWMHNTYTREAMRNHVEYLRLV